MWFVFANSASSNGIEFAYKINNISAFVIKYHGILPTFVKIVNHGHHVELLTDADVTACDLAEFDSLMKFNDIVYVPNGTRFGTFTAMNNTIKYVHDFWNTPSVKYSEHIRSPEMVLVRPKPEKSYLIEVV
jgi:hypothetical protein